MGKKTIYDIEKQHLCYENHFIDLNIIKSDINNVN
jgi:hypothetical protein